MKTIIKVLDKEVQEKTNMTPLQFHRIKEKHPELIQLAQKAMMQDKAIEEFKKVYDEIEAD